MKPISLGPFQLQKGSVVFVDAGTCHKGNYKNPMYFDPDRYLPERAKEIDPMSDMPFYGGRRACLGKSLSYVIG